MARMLQAAPRVYKGGRKQGRPSIALDYHLASPGLYMKLISQKTRKGIAWKTG